MLPPPLRERVGEGGVCTCRVRRHPPPCPSPARGEGTLRRVEDARLLRGGGRFVDDVDRPGQLWMRVVRSTVAHARLLGVEAEGRTVLTVEGVAEGEKLHPVQQKFLEHAALQCGFCTPGFIVAAKALLDENKNPTEEETRYWLAGNLCRCTGYDKIIRAVLDAAAVMRGENPPSPATR